MYIQIMNEQNFNCKTYLYILKNNRIVNFINYCHICLILKYKIKIKF